MATGLRASDDSLSTNERSALNLAPTLMYRTTVLGTPTEGYQISGIVRFAILVPFTASDNGNRHNCVLFCTEPNCTAQWKQAISSQEEKKEKNTFLKKQIIVVCVPQGLFKKAERGYLKRF